jgi:hypothetical protein
LRNLHADLAAVTLWPLPVPIPRASFSSQTASDRAAVPIRLFTLVSTYTAADLATAHYEIITSWGIDLCVSHMGHALVQRQNSRCGIIYMRAAQSGIKYRREGDEEDRRNCRDCGVTPEYRTVRFSSDHA